MSAARSLRPTDLLALETTDEAWQLLQAPGPDHLLQGAAADRSVFVVLVSDGGYVQELRVEGGNLGADELIQVVCRACMSPKQGEPRRPRTIVVEDLGLAASLALQLAPAGIDVRTGEVPMAQEVHERVLEELAAVMGVGGEGLGPLPAWLHRFDPEEVRAYFEAAKRFYLARPWQVMPPDRFVAFRVGQGQWRYALVLGHNGEEFGLGVFPDWLTVCRVLNDTYAPFGLMDDDSYQSAVEAAGDSEAVTLWRAEDVPAEDMALIKRLKVGTIAGGYPLAMRASMAGAAEPRFSPATYGALLGVLGQRAERAWGRSITSIKATVESPEGPVEVRFPARGSEQEPADDYWRIRIPYRTGPDSAPTGERVVFVEAPGEAKWHQVATAAAAAAKRIPDTLPWLTVLLEDDASVVIWLDRAPVKEPSPTVGQVAGLKDADIGNFNDRYPVDMERIRRPEGASVRAWVEGEE